MALHVILLGSVVGANPYASAQSSTGRENGEPTATFTAPKMTLPKLPQAEFQFEDVGAKIPNYTPGRQWGAQGAPLSLMQKPLPSEKSIEAYSVPEGFTLSIWAKEQSGNWPQKVVDHASAAGLEGKPIAMNWDERGRLWICETIDYPNELQSPGQGRDRIKICEDTDNDGVADKFTLFAQNLSIPSTLVRVHGGVIVQDGQSTIYLKDTDGDDIADFRQVLITGWALGDTHGGVSNFQYGPDNWIWSMQGYNNSEPVINGEPQMRFRQGFWRFKLSKAEATKTNPAYKLTKGGISEPSSETSHFNDHTLKVDALEFVRATNNNTWGLGFSEEGYVFGSTANNCPSVHMPIPNRYYDRVAGWSPKTLEKISPDAKFKAIDEGIRQVDVHGGYTAACGAALYTARNYPQAWWNRISMVCEPTGHLVGGFVLNKSGADYRSENLFNVVASVDDWAAPIMAEVGPDGNVWVLDWYNFIVQHNPTPNGFKTGKGAAYESDLRDKRFARVYRLIYNAGKSSPSHSRNLQKASKQELVDALSDPNFFWRKTAQRLLMEQNTSDDETLGALVALVLRKDVDAIGLNTGAMHALWTLSGLANADNKKAQIALDKACKIGFQHPSAAVRDAAIVQCSQPGIAEAIDLGILQDKDARVRLSALLRLADLNDGSLVDGTKMARMVLAEPMISEDQTLLDAWTAAASRVPVETLVELTNDVKFVGNRSLTERVSILAEHIARTSVDSKVVSQLLHVSPNSVLSRAVWEGLSNGWPKNVTIELSEKDQEKFRTNFLAKSTSVENKAAILAVADKWSIENLEEQIREIQSSLFAIALDPMQSENDRLNAWTSAVKIDPKNMALLDATERLLTPQLKPDLGAKAIDALQSARVEGMSNQLLKLKKKLGPSLGNSILRYFLSRTETTKQLLDEIENGMVDFSELQLDQKQAILSHPEREIATRASKLMNSKGAMVTSNRQALVDEWMPLTDQSGDLQNGVAMYKKHCAQCHKHGELGNAIGPNLTGIAVHPKPEILLNILDPSRSVESNFRTYQILTSDGTVISGMLAGESSNSLRIINAQGKELQVLREDIDEMNISTKSLMPEGFETSISKQEMIDLMAFLSHRDQYLPLNLVSAATINGRKGIPLMRNSSERIELQNYGSVQIDKIPFEVLDPQEGAAANLIALQSSNGRFPSRLPAEVSIPCSGNFTALHLLCATIPFGPPGDAKMETESLVVRARYQDDTSTDIPLLSGKHLATFKDKVDVPNSKLAIESNGKQVRYVKLELDPTKALKGIEFVKGKDSIIPVVFAATVESAGSESH